MTPGARIAAAIEIIDLLDETGAPADGAIERYFRGRRYAGAKDRRAVTERVFGIVRRRARLDWWMLRVQDNRKPDGRRRALADLALADGLARSGVEDLFDGAGYAPKQLTAEETELVDALAGRNLDHADQPAWVAHEFPSWLERPLSDLLNGYLPEEMDALNTAAPLDLRVNTLKGDCARALEVLKNDRIEAEPTALSPIGLRIQDRVNLQAATAYKGGFVEVQDEGSQIIALLVGAEAGMKVADFCAGAGGKTLAIAAEMRDEGEITACDIDPRRLGALKPRLKRAECRSVESRVLVPGGDMWIHDNEGAMDRVLADAPCSGTGRWRRRPDARWRLTGRELRDLAKDQRRILHEACRLVKPGGRLIYATCSILAEENERQIEDFLEWFGGFRVIPVKQVWEETIGGASPADPARDGDFLRLTPHRHGTDGFFVAVLEKRA